MKTKEPKIIKMGNQNREEKGKIKTKAMLFTQNKTVTISVHVHHCPKASNKLS